MPNLSANSMTMIKIAHWLYGKTKEWLKYNIIDELYYKRFKKEVFYFKNYAKHLTVYRNGHGILINSFTIRVLNKEKFEKLEREIDISDSKKQTCFPEPNRIRNVPLGSRFRKFGFWYLCDSNGCYDLIQEVEIEPFRHQKGIKFNFKIDKRVLMTLNSNYFYLTYALSIPGMFPIQNGFLDMPNLPDNFDQFNSSLEVIHRIEKLNYIVAFEKGIAVDNSTIKFSVLNKTKTCHEEYTNKKELKLNFANDIFYDKYSINIKRPKYHSQILINWDVKKSGH